MYCRGWPAAFQRTPPHSQTDRANPHEQRTIHARESASIDSAHRFGRTAESARWIKLTAEPLSGCDRHALKPSAAERLSSAAAGAE